MKQTRNTFGQLIANNPSSIFFAPVFAASVGPGFARHIASHLPSLPACKRRAQHAHVANHQRRQRACGGDYQKKLGPVRREHFHLLPFELSGDLSRAMSGRSTLISRSANSGVSKISPSSTRALRESLCRLIVSSAFATSGSERKSSAPETSHKSNLSSVGPRSDTNSV